MELTPALKISRFDMCTVQILSPRATLLKHLHFTTLFQTVVRSLNTIIICLMTLDLSYFTDSILPELKLNCKPGLEKIMIFFRKNRLNRIFSIKLIYLIFSTFSTNLIRNNM